MEELDLYTDGYELPIFLEDQTGLLTGSVFTDLYNRQKIIYLCLSDASDTEFLTVAVPGSALILSSSSAPTTLLEQSNWARVMQLQWMIICPEYPVLLGEILYFSI